MKKKLIYIFILLLSMLVQVSFLPVIFEKNVVGDNVLMLILAWSILDGFGPFLAWSIFAGILYDLVSFSTIGTHALIFLLVVYFVSFFSRRFSVEVRGSGVILLFIFVVVAALLSHAIVASAFALQMKSMVGYWKIFGSPGVILLQIICDLVFFAFWFNVIRGVKKFFSIEA